MKSIQAGMRMCLFLVVGVSVLLLCQTAEAFMSPTAFNHKVSVHQRRSQMIDRTGLKAAFLASDAQQTDGEGASSSGGNKNESLRDTLRGVTGFSLTACRATWRAATGISLTAIYASTVAFTGLWIRKIMHAVLSVFPAWVSREVFHYFRLLIHRSFHWKAFCRTRRNDSHSFLSNLVFFLSL